MDLIVAFVAGAIVGWAVARLRDGPKEQPRTKRTFRPNKRQRQILATLPPDPVRPSLDELIAEEASDLGVDTIPGADGVHLGIRLKVWRRDHPALDGCESDRLAFVLAPHVTPTDAGESDLRLECRPAGTDEPSGEESSDDPG